MTPTNKLRFVERTNTDHPTHPYTIRVLQQWWAKTPHGAYPPDVGEWRDVPLEEEA